MTEKRTISVSENGTINIDGQNVMITDLTQELLEGIVDSSLEGNVEFNILGSRPIARFFKSLDDGTKEGSELRGWKQKLDAEGVAKVEEKAVESHPDIQDASQIVE